MVTRTKKIFVGGLSAPSTLEDVKNYFEQFGAVSTPHFLSKKNTVWTVKSDAMLIFDLVLSGSCLVSLSMVQTVAYTAK